MHRTTLSRHLVAFGKLETQRLKDLKIIPRNSPLISDAEFMARRNPLASKAYQFSFTENPIRGRAKDLFNKQNAE